MVVAAADKAAAVAACFLEQNVLDFVSGDVFFCVVDDAFKLHHILCRVMTSNTIYIQTCMS